MKTTILLVLFTIQLCNESIGQQSIYVGIPRANFDHFASDQRNSNWCWAASLQMIFNYYGVDLDQASIVARSYGTDPFGNLPNWVGHFQIITANLNNWNVTRSGRRYAVQASVNLGAPNPTYLIQELSAQRPILVGYTTGPGSGHAVVITGCSYVLTTSGPYIQTIIVRDPWPSPQNIATAGRVEHTASDFAQTVQAHWYIRIQ